MDRYIDARAMQGSDGRSYVVREFQERIDASHHGGRASIDGFKRLELDDGREVIMLDGKPTIRGTAITLQDA